MLLEILYSRCAGIDVPKETAVVCVRCCAGPGKAAQEGRTFGTLTRELLDLSDWLAPRGVTPLARESTGVYGKPVSNLWGGRSPVILVNAQHIKKVPGRKTAVKDGPGIAERLQRGLLKASLVPAAPLRELRHLTRQRTQLIGERAAVANRIQEVLEGANSKLGSVASDVLGVSGREMLEALCAGQTEPVALAELARKRLREKLPALRLALHGRVTEHPRFLVRRPRDHLQHLEDLIGRVSERLEGALAPCAEPMQRLRTLPGINQRVTAILMAESGTTRGQSPTAAHLASGTGMCPGDTERAGKRRRGRAPNGNRWRRRGLAPAAGAASHTKDPYLAAQ